MGINVVELKKLTGENNSKHTESDWIKHIVPSEARSLAEAAEREPENGVYLVARTWQAGRVLELDAHFERLEHSARTLGRTVVLPRGLIRETIALHLPYRDGAIRDGRFRVTAVLDDPVRILVSIEEAHPVPAELLRVGAVCEVLRGAARTNAEVKSTAWMHERIHLHGTIPEPYEYLLADDQGFILEGATSNFYAVLNGALITADRGVLRGIARRIVLLVAPGIVPIVLQPVAFTDIPRLEEAFITSATRGVIPVRRIGSHDLSAPGPVTRRIAAAYDQWLETHLEPLVPSLKHEGS